MAHHRLVLVVAGSLLMTSARMLAGQETPAEVYRQFLSSLSQRDWAAAASKLDLAAIVVYRDSILAWARRTPPRREFTVDDMMRQDPAMPRAVAEYNLVLQRRLAVEHPTPRIIEFPTIPTFDSLQALAPLDLGSAWLRGHDHRERFREDIRRLGCTDSLAQKTPPSEVLGVVQPTDSVAFVLYTEPGWQVSQLIPYADRPLIAHLRRGPEGWRILLSTDLLRPVNSFWRMSACPSS